MTCVASCFDGKATWICTDCAYRLRKLGEPAAPTVGVLMFSTSERSRNSPALELRETLLARGMRAYNPRSKTASTVPTTRTPANPARR